MRVTEKYLLFWTAKDIYSNFYMFDFVHKEIMFHSSEQAVMWHKAKLFGADMIAEEILKASLPVDCKKLGRSKKIPFVESVWIEKREQIYKAVLYDKFKNQPLLQEILNTGNLKFVEASPYDGIWGVKLAENDPRILDESQWQGLNLLGKCLNEVRSELKKKYGERI